ncbi:MAG: helix-turn-helix transcriptional regulator [Euryarchaeota archaeon]|nr:helix-turn-helix transcriptional regulator [Euryarchaeota archaeon]
MPPDSFCGVSATIQAVGTEWKLRIVHHLLEGPRRFNQLKEAMPDVSSKTLSRTLKALQEGGLVSRRVHAEGPLAVEYSLTPGGMDMEPLVREMRRWGETWLRPGRGGGRIRA